MQEVRDAITTFRYGHGRAHSGAASSDATDSAGFTSVDGAKDGQQQQRRKFTIAVADTFGEGGPVR